MTLGLFPARIGTVTRMKWLKATFLAAILGIIFVPEVGALMTSTNYRLYGDSVGSVGGRGTSTNYILEGTAEEATGGEGSSTNYTLLGGFQSLSEHPTFTFSISASALALGTLTTSSVASGSYTVTTSTNAPFGFTTYVVDDGNLRSGANDIDDVADGTVTAGSEEYGIVTSGTYAQIGSDTGLTTAQQTVASHNKWINGAATTVTHNAAISSSTPAGTYTHTVTYVSVGNF